MTEFVMRWAGNWMNQQRHRTTMAYNNLVGLAESVTLVMALRIIASALRHDHIHNKTVSISFERKLLCNQKIELHKRNGQHSNFDVK